MSKFYILDSLRESGACKFNVCVSSLVESSHHLTDNIDVWVEDFNQGIEKTKIYAHFLEPNQPSKLPRLEMSNILPRIYDEVKVINVGRKGRIGLSSLPLMIDEDTQIGCFLYLLQYKADHNSYSCCPYIRYESMNAWLMQTGSPDILLGALGTFSYNTRKHRGNKAELCFTVPIADTSIGINELGWLTSETLDRLNKEVDRALLFRLDNEVNQIQKVMSQSARYYLPVTYKVGKYKVICDYEHSEDSRIENLSYEGVKNGYIIDLGYGLLAGRLPKTMYVLLNINKQLGIIKDFYHFDDAQAWRHLEPIIGDRRDSKSITQIIYLRSQDLLDLDQRTKGHFTHFLSTRRTGVEMVILCMKYNDLCENLDAIMDSFENFKNVKETDFWGNIAKGANCIQQPVERDTSTKRSCLIHIVQYDLNQANE